MAGEIEEEALPLDAIEVIISEVPELKARVLHVSRMDQEHPAWVNVELPQQGQTSKERARQRPIDKEKKEEMSLRGCFFNTAFVLIIGVVLLSFCSDKSGSTDDGNPSELRLQNSSWDSSVSVVKDYLKGNLKDPDSYEGIEWSEVQKLESGQYMVRHKYRAKNSYGGYVVENQVFFYDETGEIFNVTPVTGE